jgi:hypothetical protein
MHSRKWVVEPVDVPEPAEFPRLLLWKRTALLGVIGIGIGLGGGYFWGRSMVVNPEQANAAQKPVYRVKFMPIPDADRGEFKKARNDNEAVQSWMPPAADSPTEISPPSGQTRPAFIGLENASPRKSDRG